MGSVSLYFVENTAKYILLYTEGGVRILKRYL